MQRAAATIRRTVQGQARIIDDLLDMSRTNTGKLAVNRVPLLLGEAIQPCMAWALAEARRQGRAPVRRRAWPSRSLIDGDPVRDRADRLEPAQQRDQVHAAAAARSRCACRHDDDEALLEVTDTGRGIAPAFLPQVFEMFQPGRRGDHPRRGRPGHRPGAGEEPGRAARRPGRGRIGRARGGAPRFGSGCRCTSAPASAPLDEAEEAAPGRTIAGSRVLLVDDTPDTLETFGYLLEHEGARVTPREQRRRGAGADARPRTSTW